MTTFLIEMLKAIPGLVVGVYSAVKSTTVRGTKVVVNRARAILNRSKVDKLLGE
jgi:hypothetical protein